MVNDVSDRRTDLAWEKNHGVGESSILQLRKPAQQPLGARSCSQQRVREYRRVLLRPAKTRREADVRGIRKRHSDAMLAVRGPNWTASKLISGENTKVAGSAW